MTATFSHMIFYVEDIPRGLAFYEKAFGIPAAFVHESGAYAELKTGVTRLAFASEQLGTMNLPGGYQKHRTTELPAGNELVLTVEDVAKAHTTALAAGASDVAGPKQKPWGQTIAYVRDPNGLLVEIASPMG